MWGRTLSAIATATAVAGCSGAVHRLPQVEQTQMLLAERQIDAAERPVRRRLTDEQVLDTLDRSLDRVRPAAQQICREMAVGVCTWRFIRSRERDLNAGAGAGGVIVVNRGTVEFAKNDEEVAVVIAHEMGHQSANHYASGMNNESVGRFLGAMVGAVGGDRTARATANLGGQIGRVSFSKEQEREADYLAALALYRAGMDLERARGMYLTMGRLSDSRESGLMDSHPAGPERLAAWDKAVQEIRASNGALPPRSR